MCTCTSSIMCIIMRWSQNLFLQQAEQFQGPPHYIHIFHKVKKKKQITLPEAVVVYKLVIHVLSCKRGLTVTGFAVIVLHANISPCYNRSLATVSMENK